MNWHEIEIYTTEEAVDVIANFLHEAGAGGVAIEESGTLDKERDTRYGELYDVPLNDIPAGFAILKAYFSVEIAIESIIEQIKLRINELPIYDINPGEYTLLVREVNEDSWADAWKQYFKPFKVTEHLTIKPTWEIYHPRSDEEKIIEIDPKMAFGTGTHPTTALCLRALEQVLLGGEDVIDVGTGSGILAIGACKLGAGRVLALDLDPVAVESATENITLNHVQDRVNVQQSDLLNVLRYPEKLENSIHIPVQIVVANILAEIILLFVDDMLDVLQKDGIYIVSGIYKNKEEAVKQALITTGFYIEDCLHEDNWVAIIARKM